jgi:hypothetical protein
MACTKWELTPTMRRFDRRQNIKFNAHPFHRYMTQQLARDPGNIPHVSRVMHGLILSTTTDNDTLA